MARHFATKLLLLNSTLHLAKICLCSSANWTYKFLLGAVHLTAPSTSYRCSSRQSYQFIHQMARHFATKLLLLSSQTKLTLTLTLTDKVTLTHTLTIIFMCTFWHPWKGLSRFIQGIFSGFGFAGGQIITLPICWFSCTQLSMHQLQEMHPLSLKEGFLLGMCKKKGLGLFTLLWA